MSKFAHCHPDKDLMWCQHFNGSWIAFPIKNRDEEKQKKETALPDQEEVVSTTHEEIK